MSSSWPGARKLTQPKETLAGQMAWVEDFSQNTVRLIGLAEVLAAIGLILPPLVDVLPWLTPTAALGLVLLMAGAVYTHQRRNEPQGMVITGVLLAFAAIVMIGRFWIEPL